MRENRGEGSIKSKKYLFTLYLLLEGGRGIMHFGSNAFEDESITGYNMGSQEIKRFNKFIYKISKKQIFNNWRTNTFLDRILNKIYGYIVFTNDMSREDILFISKDINHRTRICIKKISCLIFPFRYWRIFLVVYL